MALADDIKTQIDAWTASNDAEKIVSFRNIIDGWAEASVEKAQGPGHADLDAKETACKSDLDTLLT
jgi:hypothetical protein